MFRYAVATSILACICIVTGHGGGQHYTIDGVVYKGNWEYLNNTEGSIQRLWYWDHNVYDLDNPDLACGHDGTPSVKSYHAPIQAGSTISVNYTVDGPGYVNDDGGPWTFGHPYGPMLAYLAACPDEGCEGVNINAPIWFKIWEAGLLSGNWVDGHWAMRDVYMGANLDIPTPASLKPGKYLLRHEMINLQTGPVQFFPNCIQLEVSGSGNRLPVPDELVAISNAYEKDREKSFTTTKGSPWFYVENANNTVYPMPGPSVWEG
ncbi:glycosyl hydrolase family 61-domain-containing protein [Xylaria curta]|nr:glycosyl hydrolase family 61-domain-containing protein [Xylaria curta]